MSISAHPQSAIIARKRDSVSASSDEKPVNKGPYGKWLVWLQSLLKAHTLILYRVDTLENQRFIKPLACLPELESSASSAYSRCAVRCAERGAAVRAVSGSQTSHCVVCLPDIASVGKGARHVLLIDRRTATSLDSQTQIRLVSWAFESLGSLAGGAVPARQDNPLIPWALARVVRSTALAPTFAQLMDRLVEITDSDQCHIASLRVRGGNIRSAHLVALSGQKKIDGRLPASDSLIIAVEEAYCGKSLPLPVVNQQQVAPSVTAQTPVTSASKSCARLIVPVFCSGRWYAVSFERSAAQAYGKTEQADLEQSLTSVMTLLVLSDPKVQGVNAACKRLAFHSYQNMIAHLPRAVFITSCCVLLLLFLLVPAEHRISAPLSVEASERHVLIAPVDGFVESVSVKAGDRVKKGQVLASLDDLDLKLQQQKLESEIRQTQQAYAKALAVHDRIEVTRLKEEASSLLTELAQLDLQRGRMLLVAPVDAVVLSGSWDDFLGAAVSSGDALFTLGSTSSHRLVLDVSEYDVKYVKSGQSVGIRMSADPSNVLSGTVTAIMPLAVAADGTNSVQVHAALDQPASMRPGMQGLGKVLVGRQARVMQWLRRATTRLVWLGWRLGVLK
ncbi:MAG: efflux RND transporter periplasmic adaptor subunit [Granulosicoccus sp.]